MADIQIRLQILACFVEACSVETSITRRQGGELCSVIFLYAQHGDPLVKSVAVSFLTTVTKPLYLMLGHWILYGELEDPFMEFFIAAYDKCKKEHLWHSKFYIR